MRTYCGSFHHAGIWFTIQLTDGPTALHRP
jgi:hypothetical protein